MIAHSTSNQKMGTNKFRYVCARACIFYLTGLILEDIRNFPQQGKCSVQESNLQPGSVPQLTEAQLYHLFALRHANTSRFCYCN